MHLIVGVDLSVFKLIKQICLRGVTKAFSKLSLLMRGKLSHKHLCCTCAAEGTLTAQHDSGEQKIIKTTLA